MPTEARVLVLVAHPDDETLWAGGTLLLHRGWTTFVGTLCRASDEQRASRFHRVLDLLGAQGAMADLDDGPAQAPLDANELRAAVLSLVPSGPFDLLMTHGPCGEYTRHLRHEEVSRGVLGMWVRGEILCAEVWLFAYEDGQGNQLPRAEAGADLELDLPEEVWARKRSLLTEVYGFTMESWEARATPRREAFWRVGSPGEASARLEGPRPP